MNAAAFRAETVDRFANWGIAANTNLPLVERPSVTPPAAARVAARAVSICYVVGIFYDADRTELVRLLQDFKLWDVVPSSERGLLEAPTVPPGEKQLLDWLPESAQVMAWSLRLADLNHLQRCDDTLYTLFPFKTDPTPFISEAKLRPYDEIGQELDVLYMLHWATVDALLKSQQPPVDPIQIRFRRRAIEWIWGTNEWDQISLDT